MQEVVIVKIHKDDAYYVDRKELIGQTGRLENFRGPTKRGYIGCEIKLNNAKLHKEHGVIAFFAVMLEEV